MGDLPDDEENGHLQCPFCHAYEVDRLYLASLRLDSCVCASCGARWDEDASTGEYRGRAAHQSVLAPRQLARADHPTTRGT
ncbi:MAG: hypothetical protein AB7L84_03370 [Acidimicrobiia bacterium]